MWDICVVGSKKKICMLFGFFLRVSSPDPPQPRRGFKKNPSGTPWALGPALEPIGVLLWFLKSPLGFGGCGEDTRRKNPNNMHIFF